MKMEEQQEQELTQEIKRAINGMLTELGLKYNVEDNTILSIIQEQFL